MVVLASVSSVLPLRRFPHQKPCANSGAFRITEACIGPLPVRATVSQLRAIRAGSKDSLHYGENDAYPGVVFHLVGLNAFGWQYNDSLQTNAPIDTWVVKGRNATLPEGIPITAEWSMVQQKYGQGIVDTEDGIAVMFCRFPSLIFELTFDGARRLEGSGRIDMSRIPPDAHIASITIPVEPMAGWNC